VAAFKAAMLQSVEKARQVPGLFADSSMIRKSGYRFSEKDHAPPKT
jgi:hypothetical protein